MTPMIPEDWEANLLQTRLDWQAHQVRNRISRSEVARAEQDLLPDIGISFNLEQMGEGEGLEDALQIDQTNWSIQLELLSPLDRFEEESTLFRKKMAATRLKRAEQALQRKIRRETREAFADLQMEEQNHRINLKRRQQAAMALDLAKTRYEQGVSDNLDILDAESVFADAEAGISRSLVAYNLAAVALAQSLGVLDRQWIVLALIPPDALAGQTDERE
jgi:outer membrane protein TolC